MSVGEFCNREVVVAAPDTDMIGIAMLMRQHHVGDIVIVDNADPHRVVPLGILTDRDLVLEVLACGIELNEVNAGDIMSRELVTAHEKDGMWHTLRRMRSHGIRRLVVVNDQGGLEGILTLDDIIELLADELSTLARIPSCGQEKEKRCRE